MDIPASAVETTVPSKINFLALCMKYLTKWARVKAVAEIIQTRDIVSIAAATFSASAMTESMTI